MAQAGSPRIPVIDIARGVALLAMAVYHFTWDLEFFGYAEPGLTAEGGWKLFARCIASSFLFLVGVSLVLAHGKGVRWPGFWRRWLMVAASAAVITLATWYAFPDSFIFFGILHQIALASLLGLPFLRVPAAVTALVAAAVIVAPHFLRDPLFDAWPLLWVGLSSVLPRSNDYVPLFPWFGAVLAGIAAATFAMPTALPARLAALGAPRWSAPLSFCGRHSLAFYLLHQPVLIALVAAFSWFAPPNQATPERLQSSCARSCEDIRDAAFCERYCACVVDRVVAADRLDEAFGEDQNEEIRRWLGEVAGQCTAETERATEEDGTP
ncbi:MAG: DUF1624 domain-containing protein [Rhizobiaceae bacterium]|nr:DUF1624 domain-containing protein [Rhizobiaceae bacterium]